MDSIIKLIDDRIEYHNHKNDKAYEDIKIIQELNLLRSEVKKLIGG